ncbi:MAG: phosphatase PAP2 family protein [Chloroflexota bacterium]|mgnify:CR=1 FL=1
MDSKSEIQPTVDARLPAEQVTPFWSVYGRRVLLVSLVVGLILFLIWLPSETRATLLFVLRTQWILVSLLVLFALVVLSLVWTVGHHLDTQIFLLFNLRGYHAKWLDHLMWLATQLGNIVTAFTVAFVFFWLNYRDLAVGITLGTITLWILVETVKALADRARPFLVLEGTRIIGWRERGRSFPSGHTAQTFFLVTLLCQLFQPGLWGTIALYGVAALVGFTRMYVGAHYPRDVIGGAALGSVWGVLFALGIRIG